MKRGEKWEEKKENCKKEDGNLEMEVGKVIQRGEDFFFTFENDKNVFWVYQNGDFLSKKKKKKKKKKHFTPGKKSGKMALTPQKNMPVTPLLPWLVCQ